MTFNTKLGDFGLFLTGLGLVIFSATFYNPFRFIGDTPLDVSNWLNPFRFFAKIVLNIISWFDAIGYETFLNIGVWLMVIGVVLVFTTMLVGCFEPAQKHPDA